MKIAFCTLAVLISAALASVVRRQAGEAGVYVLPDGSELVVGSIVGGFTCEGKIYGYYADTANACRLFHVCVPAVLADGTEQTTLYSFFCGNQTVFDQQYLVCSHPESATPCEESASWLHVNENFGRTETPPQVARQPPVPVQPQPPPAPQPPPIQPAAQAGSAHVFGPSG